VPDDSRTKGSTVGGRESGRPDIGLADASGSWNEGESTMVTMGDGPSPPPPGGGAKDGESTIMGGSRDGDVPGTGREPTPCMGADDGDVAERTVPCSTMPAPPSRKPPSLATVGGGTARASLNLEPF
jgi:hypothetical protein